MKVEKKYINPGNALGIGAFLILPVAIIVPKGLTVLFSLVAIAVLGIFFATPERRPRKFALAAKWCMGLVLLGAISVLWSPTPKTTLISTAILSLVFLGGFALVFTAQSLNKCERDFAKAAMYWGGIAGFSLLGFELLSNAKLTLALREVVGKEDSGIGNPIDLFNTSVTVAALYFWPWAATVWQKWNWGSFVLFVPAAACFALVREDAALAAFVVGAFTVLIMYFIPRLGPNFFLLCGICAIAAAPLLPSLFMSAIETDGTPRLVSHSAYHRLVIWNTTVDHIKQKPLFGNGLNTSRALYNKTQKIRYMKYDKIGRPWWGATFEPIPLHPHNGVLQIWLELGISGAALLLGFFVVIIRSLVRVKDNIFRAISFGGVTSAMLIMSISYGIWQGWWQATLWLFATLLVVVVSCEGGEDQETSSAP